MTSENDGAAPSSVGMFSIDEFCRRNQIGRSTTYGEIASGRLKAVKIGRLTRITNDAEIEWRRSLPAVERRANLDRDAANYVRRSAPRDDAGQERKHRSHATAR